MGRITSSQNNFNSGEISPRTYARSDVEGKYGNALETATNCTVTPHGPIHRRPGTQFIAEVKTSSKAVKLIRFQFSQTDSFILEFGESYIRFYTAGAQVDSGGSPYEISSPYLEADLPSLSVVQFGDILYIANKGHAPRTLTRTATADWALALLGELPPPTYEKGEEPATTVTPGAATGTGVTFTAGAATFLQADIGRQIGNKVGTGRAAITAITSTTVVTCDIVEDFPSTSAIASGDWKLDLSPIATLDTNGSSVGSIIKIVSRPLNTPEIANGSFDNSASNWANLSTGTGTIGWDSTNRTLELQGGGTSNLAIAEQPLAGMWVGNFTLSLDTTVSVDYTIGTTSGGSEVGSGTITAGVGQEVTFTSMLGLDTFYFNITPTTDTETADIDNVVITGTSDTFRTGDVGNYLLFSGGVAQIITRTDATTVECEVLKSLNSTADTSNWTMETETWTAARGYPRAVGLYQERLVFGGSIAQPQTIWMSETGIFNGFGIGPDDEDSLEVDLSSNQTNTINWIATQRDLVVGTAGAEATLAGTSSGAPITPSSIRQIPRTYHGSGTQIPATVGSEVIFVQGSSRKIRTFRYDFGIDGYAGEDLTFLAEHITAGEVVELAYTQDPDSIVWAVDAAGDLITGTYERDQKVIGWTKNTTDGSFENVATIANGAVDEVWVVVNRTINGATVRYIELFEKGDGTDRLHGYSDSFLTYSDPKTITAITKADPGVVTAGTHGYSDGDKVKLIGVGGMTEAIGKTYVVANKTSTTYELTDVFGANIDTSAFTAFTSGGESHKLVTTISGLDHLEGAVVQVKADGATHPDKTVASNAITLDRDSYEVTVGIRYTTTIKTLKKEFNVGEGTMQGQRQRPVRPIIRVYKSARPLLNGEFLPARNSSDEMDEAVPLVTGDLSYGAIPWNNTGQLTFTTSDPLPLRLQGVFGTLEGSIK